MNDATDSISVIIDAAPDLTRVDMSSRVLCMQVF